MSITKPRMKLAHFIPQVCQLRAEGRTLQEIGDHLHLSKQRIHQVIRGAKRLEDIQAEWGFPFSIRTYNVLHRLAVRSKDEALSLYRSGHIHPNSVTGFGWVSYKEICDWLEVPMLKKRPKEARLCPHCGKEL